MGATEAVSEPICAPTVAVPLLSKATLVAVAVGAYVVAAGVGCVVPLPLRLTSEPATAAHSHATSSSMRVGLLQGSF